MKMRDKHSGITIDVQILQQIREDAQNRYPSEACGMLLCEKEDPVITRIIPLENERKDVDRITHFYADPISIFRAEQTADAEGYKLLGFYHSHPEHEAVLSAEDEKYLIPGMICLILPVTERAVGNGRAYRKETIAGKGMEITVRVMEKD